MYRLASTSVIAGIVTLTTASIASSANLNFEGLVLSTCVIAVGTPGVLDLGTNGTVLSTKTGLGVPARAVITATGTGFSTSVSPVTTFAAAPSGGNAGTTFQTSYSMTGITAAIGVGAGVNTSLGIGITSLAVDLQATHPTMFPAGLYRAVTVVTCE